MYPDPAPYQPHRMTQKPCTRPTGWSPRSRQAAKSGTVSPEEKADDSRRRTAASGSSSELSLISGPSVVEGDDRDWLGQRHFARRLGHRRAQRQEFDGVGAPLVRFFFEADTHDPVRLELTGLILH